MKKQTQQQRDFDQIIKRFKHDIKAVFEIEMLQAIQDFADKLTARLKEKEQHYISMYDWNGHSAVVDCENEVDELLKELRK